ncbi:hypothetical protein PV325_004388 [Microctonus aethiopoides]|nr:hypothetical protein PV325_004388 [Microctonus aethiopoides]
MVRAGVREQVSTALRGSANILKVQARDCCYTGILSYSSWLFVSSNIQWCLPFYHYEQRVKQKWREYEDSDGNVGDGIAVMYMNKGLNASSKLYGLYSDASCNLVETLVEESRIHASDSLH